MKRLAFVLILLQCSALWAALPKQDANVSVDVRISVDSQGKAVRRVNVTTQINTPWAVDKLSDPKVRFDASRQDLKVIQATTITRDNRRVTTRKVAQNLSTLPALSKAPMLALHREMVVTMLGIEEGCKTVLEYQVSDRKPLPFGRVWRFALPVHQRIDHIRVEVKSPVDVKWMVLNAGPGMAPRVTRNNNALVLQWKNVGPWPVKRGPVLVVYRPDRQDAMANALKPASKPGHRLDAMLAKTMQKTGVQRFAAVLATLKSGLRVIPLVKGVFAERPRPESVVLSSGYATPMEAAIVLQTALQKAGFGARLAMYGPKNTLPVQGGGLWGMTGVGVRVTGVTDRPLLVQVPGFTALDQGVAISGRRFWVLNRNPHVALGPSLDCARGMSQRLSLRLKIDTKGRFHGTLDIRQDHDARAFMQIAAKGVKAWAKAMVGRVLPGAKVKAQRLLGLSAGRVAVQIKVAGRLNGTGKSLLFPVYSIAQPFESVMGATDSLRLDNAPQCLRLDIHLALPKEWHPITAGGPVQAHNDTGKFVYKTIKNGRLLNIHALLAIHGTFFDKKGIDDLQRIIRTASMPALWRMILVKSK